MLCPLLVVFCALVSAQANALVMVADTSVADHTVQLQSALDGLPKDRNLPVVLRLEGEFRISNTIVLDSYTTLDIRAARLQQIGEEGFTLIRNRDQENGDTRIEIIGGEIIGNGKHAKEGGDCLHLVRTSQLRLERLTVSHCPRDGAHISGRGRHTRHVVIQNSSFDSNRRNGLLLSWAMRNVVVDSVSARSNRVDGIYSDHSESNYRNISASLNGQDGIFIRNVFNNSYTDLTTFRNKRHGIRVVGLCYSSGANWVSHINGQASAPGISADIFFESDASMSYGITRATRIDGIRVGANPHMPKLKTPYALYVEPPRESAQEFSSVLLNDVLAEGSVYLPAKGGPDVRMSN